jgi:hypothetical protein
MRPVTGIEALARRIKKSLNFRRNAPEGSPVWTGDMAAEVVRLCHEAW